MKTITLPNVTPVNFSPLDTLSRLNDSCIIPVLDESPESVGILAMFVKTLNLKLVRGMGRTSRQDESFTSRYIKVAETLYAQYLTVVYCPGLGGFSQTPFTANRTAAVRDGRDQILSS